MISSYFCVDMDFGTKRTTTGMAIPFLWTTDTGRRSVRTYGQPSVTAGRGRTTESLPSSRRLQLRDLFRRQRVLDAHEQREVRALDLALEGHDLVGLLEDLRLVSRRLLEKLRHLPRLLLQV